MYRTFYRTANTWDEFFRTRRHYTGDTYQTVEEARAACREYNANRTPREVSRGKKMEYEEG